MGAIMQEVCQVASAAPPPSHFDTGQLSLNTEAPPTPSLCLERSRFHLLDTDVATRSRLIIGPRDFGIRGPITLMLFYSQWNEPYSLPRAGTSAMGNLLRNENDSVTLHRTPDLRIRLVNVRYDPWNASASIYLDGPWGYPHTFASLVVEF